jgi:hypothetical protein
MAIIIDSYSESHQSTDTEIGYNYSGVGQSFTASGCTLDSCVFFLKKNGLPTGNAVAKIYAHSGVYGSTSIPTGTALATSDNFDVSTLTTTYGLKTFTFSGANRISLTNGTYYVVTCEFSNGSFGVVIILGRDDITVTHSGNLCNFNTETWIRDNLSDLCFYVYGILPATVALTGTATASITETDIQNGGKTIVLTVTNDTWVTTGVTFNAQRQNIIDGLDSAQSETHGWDAEVKAKISVTDVVRTSDTIVTITLDAESGYDITAQETITATVPATALTSGIQVVASPTFTVDPVTLPPVRPLTTLGVG